MIGSGGLVVMNDKSCMVEVARFFMNLHRMSPAVNAFRAAREPRECWSFLRT